MLQHKHTIAVCVCTGGGRESLISCLLSVRQQLLPEQYQLTIIVVDNSVDGDIEGYVQQHLGNNHHPTRDLSCELICVREKKRGIPFARNAALVASVEINATHVVFIDDDEIAPMHWLSLLLDGMSQTRSDVVVGGVGRCESLTRARDAARHFFHRDSLLNLKLVKTAVTSNVIFHSWLIQSPYNLRFDEQMVFGGSDREFFMRARQAGASIAEAPDVKVFEAWPAQRRKVSYLLMRWFRYGVSFHYRHSKNLPTIKAHVLIVLMSVYKIIGSPVKLLLLPIRPLWDKRPFKRLLGVSIADIAYGVGCLAPIFGFRLRRYY